MWGSYGAESRHPTQKRPLAATDRICCDPVVTSHLEAGQVEAQTKSLYHHGCPASQDSLTHTAAPPASDHPGTAHVSSVRPQDEEEEEEDGERQGDEDTPAVMRVVRRRRSAR